jgi:dTDP-4-amino-4,6-dideoxygalactose transaminase
MNTVQSSIPFVDLAAQYQTIEPEIHQALDRVLIRGDFVLGQDVQLFEEEFAAFCQTKYAVGVDSGTSALELALRACGVSTGDEVILPANTFVATIFAVSYVGARPVLVDVDPQTYTIDVEAVQKALTRTTKAIIPVHLYGQPADMDPIMALADQHHLIVIEDACQAHGARYKGTRVGSIGQAAAFSFYPAKNLGGYGDGGMITTNLPDIAVAARLLRNYGQTKKYHHQVIGYNHRLDTLQAAVLRVKLQHLDQWNAARRRHAKLYSDLLSDSAVISPITAPYAEHVWHLYEVDVPERAGLQKHLTDVGISTGLHYPLPIHLQPAYESLGYQRGDFPVTEKCAEHLLSLPMYAELTDEMISNVANAILSFITEGYKAVS